MVTDKEPIESVLERGTPKYGSEDHRRIIAITTDWFDFAERGKRDREDKLREAYKHLHSHLPDSKNWPHSTRVYEPIWRASLETAVAEEVKNLFAGEHLLRYVPDADSQWEIAEMVTAAVQSSMKQRKPKGVVQEILLTRRMAGTAYVLTYYKTILRDRKVFSKVPVMTLNQMVDPMTGEVQEVEEPLLDAEGNIVEQWEVTIEPDSEVLSCPWFEEIPFWEAFPDKMFSEVQDGRFFCRRKLRDERFIRDRIASGQWSEENLKYSLMGDGDQTSEPVEEIMKTLRWHQELGIDGDVDQESIESGKWFEVQTFYLDEYVIEVVNRCSVASVMPNPYMHGQKPILHIKNTLRKSGEHYGLSDWECVGGLVKNIQEMRNAGTTDALFSIYGITTVLPGANVNDLSRPRPGMVVRVRSQEDFDFRQRPTQGLQLAGGVLSMDRSALDNALGTSDAMRGALPTDNRQHATSIVKAMQQAGTRLMMGISHLVEDFVIPLGEHHLSNMIQFTDADFWARSTDFPDAKAVLVEVDLLRKFRGRVAAEANVVANEEIVLKRLMELYGMALQNPMNSTYKLDEFERTIAEIAVPGKARRLVMSPEEVQQKKMEQMQMMMMQQQMQQAQQQMGSQPSPEGNEGAYRGPGGGAREMANDRQQGVNIGQ